MCNIKMKFFAFVIITKLLEISSSEIHNLTQVAINCPVLSVKNGAHAVFFDMDVHSHPEIKACILQDILTDQSVVVLNEYDIDIDTRLKDTRNLMMTNNNPTVIITTKYLTPQMVDVTQWQFFIRSNWSLLYIVVTGDNKFKCKNGTMNPKDFSLLEQVMNTLWHRLQIMRVGVVFPFTCQKKMAIYKGKRPSTSILYDRSIKLINATNSKDVFGAIKKSGEKLTQDYPMQAGLFYRYPTSIRDCENLHYYAHFDLNITNGYCGLDGMVLHDILSRFQFNISFCQDETCSYYGYGVPGNISGTLGYVNQNKLDVSFNSRFMAQYADEKVYYLHYVTTDTLCALMKKPEVIPLWHGVYNLFSPTLWALICAVLVGIGVIMWTMALINRTITGPKTMTFWWYLHNSVTTTMVGYSPLKSKTLLMIRSSCLLGSILIIAVYQGHISRVYTTVDRFAAIKTLKDLYNSQVTLYTSEAMLDVMKNVKNPEDKLQKKFFDRTQLIPGNRLGVLMQHKCAATVDRKSDAEMSILERYTDDHGTPLIDIVDECFYTYYVSYIARTGFPFYEDLQIFTQRLNEAGLPAMYYKWTQYMLDIPNSMPDIDTEPRSFSKIKLKDQCVAFGVLFVGTVASVIVFAAEMWIGRRQHLELYKRRSSYLN